MYLPQEYQFQSILTSHQKKIALIHLVSYWTICTVDCKFSILSQSQMQVLVLSGKRMNDEGKNE